MIITFLGVRGSIPSPGPRTLKYGGNTTCLFVEFPGTGHLIIDAGSGLRTLNGRLAKCPDDIRMLLTHSHWDHISGFPFFLPVFQRGRRLHLYCNCTDEQPLPGVLLQMDTPLFPVCHEDLESDISIHRIAADSEFSPLDGVKVRTIALNHPDPGLAFRIEAGGKSLVFVTDNELSPPGTPKTPYEDWVDFAQGCNLLIHDANFTQEELAARSGWGHSAYEQAVRLGCDAGVGMLMLFHHDIDRSDYELDEIGRRAKALAGDRCGVELAREGLIVEI